MREPSKIPGTTQAWEDGTLGASMEHAVVASGDIQKAVEATLAMQAISIRLPKSVIETFKALASLEGIGYQPLMRAALMRFADEESKRVVIRTAARQKHAKAGAAEAAHTV